MSAAATIELQNAEGRRQQSDAGSVARKRHINWALKAILPDCRGAAERSAAVHSGFLVAGGGRAPRHHHCRYGRGNRHLRRSHYGLLGLRPPPHAGAAGQDRARHAWATSNASVSFAKRNDEIGDLGRDFNEMVAQLKASREEIQRLHQTQMSRAEHFATLGELAAGLAHEIRNPLAGIAGVIEIVSRDLPPDSAARSVIKDAKEEAVQINRILTDLLETARPKPPQFQVQRPGRHRRARGYVCAAAGYHQAHHDRTAHPTTTLPPVDHDPNQINQVLLNLLLNAIQAMEKPGTIHVSLRRDKDAALITVADEGKGIAPENLPNIFRPFFTTKGHGTGLGLSLARRIVESHGGTITARSELGKGTQFMVRLPIDNEKPAERA